MAEHEDTCLHLVQYRGNRLRVLGGAPDGFRRRSAPEAGQIEGDGVDTGREDAVEVAMVAPPAVQGEDRGRAGAVAPTEQSRAGERREHLEKR